MAIQKNDGPEVVLTKVSEDTQEKMYKKTKVLQTVTVYKAEYPGLRGKLEYEYMAESKDKQHGVVIRFNCPDNQELRARLDKADKEKDQTLALLFGSALAQMVIKSQAAQKIKALNETGEEEPAEVQAPKYSTTKVKKDKLGSLLG